MAPPKRTVPPPSGHRHRKQQDERPGLTKKIRLAVVLALVVAALSAGVAEGFGSDASAEPTVQAFLLDWQQGNYAQAAALTNASAGPVMAELAAAYTDLDASAAFFAMSNVTQHGKTAIATYKATVDLAQAGQQWSYTAQFKLTDKQDGWVVDWTPSVINPALGPGDRLAVTTTYAPRASVTDVNGHSLLTNSADYRVGLYPGRLKDAAATAVAFSSVTHLGEQQVLGQIQAAPPNGFLSLLTLDPADFSSQWDKLATVPGLSYQKRTEQLFTSSATEAVGQIGTEDSRALRNEGAAYQPGMTVGLSGLEDTYQDELVGTPTTSVVVVDASGRGVATLWQSPGGQAGAPVRTTLSQPEQARADTVLAGQRDSAEIVAVDWRTGAIRVLASREVAGGSKLPPGGGLNARVEPGMAFSIVSAAALLSTGLSADHPLPCEPVADVGGETFTYQASKSLAATLAEDFASGCGTAFANMSRTLTPQQLTATERAFGIGASWKLPLTAFSGSAPTVSDEADVAAQATGAGGVRMSPLGLAMLAAEVASGTGQSPTLTRAGSQVKWSSALSATELKELGQLMRLAVTKGTAHAADLAGSPVYGQAGVVRSGQHSYLSWFVGYRGHLAISVLETGTTKAEAAAALAGAFLKAVG